MGKSVINKLFSVILFLKKIQCSYYEYYLGQEYLSIFGSLGTSIPYFPYLISAH